MSRFVGDQKEYKSQFHFLVTAGIIGYVFFVIVSWVPLRSDHFEYRDRVASLLKLRDGGTDAKELRKQTYDQGRELGIPIELRDIRVSNLNRKWRISLNYQREFSVPGYSRVLKYEIDRSWETY